MYIRTTTITAISDAGAIQWEGGPFIVKVNCLKSVRDDFYPEGGKVTNDGKMTTGAADTLPLLV